MKGIVALLLCLAAVWFVFIGRFEINKKAEPRACAMAMEKSSDSFDISDDEAEQIFGQLEQVLSQRRDLKVIDRTKIDYLKREEGFQQSDWASPEKTAEIGKVLGVNIICVITIYDSSYKVEFSNVNTLQKRTYNGKVSKNFITKSISVKGLKGLKKLNIKDI